MPEVQAFLSTAPAEWRSRRVAITVACVSLAFFVAAAPFARLRLPAIWAFIPIYESALAISDLITTSLLLAQFASLRTRGLLVLGCGYFFSATIVIPHALTFPMVVSPTGLLGVGKETTPWLYLIWHGAFPLFVIVYALNGRRDAWLKLRARTLILGALIATGAAVSLTTWALIVYSDSLPVLINDNRFTPTFTAVAAFDLLLTFIGFILVAKRRQQSMLDLWLSVTMTAWLFDIALSSVLNGGRFDLGYYAGRLYGLLAATFVLFMLLRETGILYTQTIQMLELEKHERRRDIAERRRLFETSIDLILVVTADGMIHRTNPTSKSILGYEPEEMIGHLAADFIFAEDIELARAAVRRLRQGDIMRGFNCRYVHKDERVVMLAWTGLWSTPDQRYFFFGRDMTEQQLNEDKFRLVVESCPNGMLMTDGAGIICLVNAQTEALFGYHRDELIGQSVDMLVPESLRARHRQNRARFVADPRMRRMSKGRELFGVRKDGTNFPAEITLNPIQSVDGILVLSVITDITERKQMERMKDEFVSTVSHELRTPLTSIAASLGLLSRGGPKLPDTATRLVNIAHANCQRLVRLINDILDIEKIESGKIVFNIIRVQVRELVERAVESGQGLAGEYGVFLRFDSRSASGDVAADFDRLTQIVTNLISNAIKFSPRGEEVVVAIEADDANVRITVRDHGPGIPDHFKGHIFEKFAQADASDTRQKGGTGLGLSIVRQLVHRLGGEVGFKDAPVRGTIFYVDLPKLEANVLRRYVPAPDKNAASVLICDDYPLAANLLAEQLGEVGFNADIVTTGHDALDHAAATRFAAILIDLQLPDCDGISLIHELRTRPPNEDTPIIVVSANPDRGRGDIRAAGLDVLDWLQKPVDIERLAHLIGGPKPDGFGHRPRILHVDDDVEIVGYINRSMKGLADIVSVDTIDQARTAIATDHFDLVILDTALAANSGLDLLPDLRDSAGDPIPVIVMSAQGANPAYAAQVQAALVKSQASVEDLIAMLRRRVENKQTTFSHERAAQ